jgi:hypothetical protein
MASSALIPSRIVSLHARIYIEKCLFLLQASTYAGRRQLRFYIRFEILEGRSEIRLEA